jgi:hypothetical protein
MTTPKEGSTVRVRQRASRNRPNRAGFAHDRVARGVDHIVRVTPQVTPRVKADGSPSPSQIACARTSSLAGRKMTARRVEATAARRPAP